MVLATRLHKIQTGLLSVDHISGIYNTLANYASREHSTNPYAFLNFSHTNTPPTGTLLDIVPIQQQDFIQNIFCIKNTDINNSVVEATKRERLHFFGAWTRFLAYYFPGVPNDLQSNNRPKQLALMAAFAKFVRQGGVSEQKHQVRTQTVQVALQSLSMTWELEGNVTSW